MKLHRPLADVRGDALHHELRLVDHEVAGVADPPVPRPGPDPSDAVMGQTAIGQLLADEKAKRLLVHRGTVATGGAERYWTLVLRARPFGPLRLRHYVVATNRHHEARGIT